MKSFITCMIKSRRMRYMEHAAWMTVENAYGILVGKAEEKRPLGRPRSRWKDIIRMDPREIGWTGCIWFRIRASGGLL
jgi:hypothetical protein